MKSIKDILTKNVGYLAVALICGAFLLTSFIEIGKTGKSPEKIIADSAATFILGMSINSLLGIQGDLTGERDEKMLSTRALHSETVERISPIIEGLDAWCNEQNARALLAERTKILAAAGLKYSDCFDSEGVALPLPEREGLTKRELKYIKRCYRRACRLELSELTAGELTSESGKAGDPNYLGPTKGEFAGITFLKDVASKIAIAAVVGYYGVEFMQDFNYAELIWRAFQVAVLLITGIIRMFKQYVFVTETYRARIVKKIDNLQKYENDKKKEKEKCQA